MSAVARREVAASTPLHLSVIEAAPAGLGSEEARRRLAEQGPNELERQAGPSAAAILLSQFKSPVVALLLAATAASALLEEWADAIAIGVVVLLNAAVGFAQEFRAERAMEALRSLTAPRARVRREGVVALVPAREVVAGDLLVLEAGDLVAADAKLVAANRLAVNEATLTGESAPVEKVVAPSAASAPLAERFDRVFMGTAVADGTGLAEVTATGMGTELGRIASLLATARRGHTPLQARLLRLSRVLLYGCVAVVALVAGVELWRGAGPLEVFRAAVALAVAAIPEGLAAIVTIALAIGVQRMVKRHVLVRKLHAVETLGCATVICTDKTGTLTTGVMEVRELWGPDSDALLEAAAACCDAQLGEGARAAVGDPTELAILAAAAGRGIHRAQLELRWPRRSERPFDSRRKRMSVWRSNGRLYVKGAVEVMLPLCRAGTAGAAEANARLAERGLRVLAVAVGEADEESNLRLLGLLGIADPPRPEAIEAVAAARAAGIETVMITGDHPITARAIAKELGIEHVHARATPEDKLRIVREWKQKGAVVAMTGDGVNDAPALKEAHIGICMGKTGTEVTREASDLVLTDDNYASIVAGVREGRGIFENIRKVLLYLLGGNAAKLALMFAAALGRLPAPLLPLDLLWVNLIIDGFAALALVREHPDRAVMKVPPRRTDEAMLGRREWLNVLASGAVEAALVLGVYVWALETGGTAWARSMAFSLVVFAELFKAFAARSRGWVLFEVGALTNLWLAMVVVAASLAQVAIHQVAPLQRVFGVGPLSVADWALCVALGLVPVTVQELYKLGRRLAARLKR